MSVVNFVPINFIYIFSKYNMNVKFRFEHLEDLVADGLITMHMEKHANDYIQRMADEAIYEQSPYSQYQKATDCRRQSCSRCHNFTPATFRIPHYCDYCRNFMWGLVQQVSLFFY